MLQIQLDLSYEVKPVRNQALFEHGSADVSCWLRLRSDFQWDGSSTGGLMDAPAEIPLGSTQLLEGDESFLVTGTCKRREWM